MSLGEEEERLGIPLSLHHMKTYGEASVCEPEREFVGKQILTLDFSASGTVTNKCLVFKPPGQWYFVIAARADQYKKEITTTRENC